MSDHSPTVGRVTEPTFLDEIRSSYDNVAASYAELVPPRLGTWRLGLAMLATFAELVETDGGGPIADVGCGPGHVTAHLESLGADAFGIDLSPGMIEMARRDHPALRFEVGSMTALDLADGSMGGVAAWYSMIHLPPEALPGVFVEFHRVLAPGGRLLLAFHVGDECRRKEQGYGHAMSLNLQYLLPERLIELAASAGLEIRTRVVVEADQGLPSLPSPPAAQACLLFRKTLPA